MVVEENGDLETEQPAPKVESILDRRNQLKRQRRNRFLQFSWRIGFTLGLAATLGWGLSQPEWKIRSLSQIKVLGNTRLSTETLERLLPVTYPSSLIRIQPSVISRQLKTYAHVDQVTISRQLFPPQVNIVVQERAPVAKAQCNNCALVYDGQSLFGKNNMWLIDSEGVVLPQASYPNVEPKTLPQLEIDGYLHAPSNPQDLDGIEGRPVTTSPQQKRRLRQMLPLLLKSPVDIRKVDWRDPNNIKLHTQLGTVHLADPTQSPMQLKAQLEALDKLRSLPTKVDWKRVAFLDLSDPQYPTLELKEKPKENPPIRTQ